jgi:hypothetical protein
MIFLMLIKMTFKTRSVICFLAAAFVLFWGAMGIAADSLDFAVIQPGQPGTSKEAQPVMDALAAYIQRQTGKDVAVKGTYFNQPGPALDFLKQSHLAWGIVRVGFYSAHARPFHMTALASTRPGGHPKDIWRLIVPGQGPKSWKTLTGKVMGNMLFEADAASCLLFGLPAARLPFRLEGTFRPLRSLRNAMSGKIAGAVLDRSQYEAVQALPLGKDIAVAHTSPDLPTSPVVWFGKRDERAGKLRAILLGMKEDHDAQTLLKLLQTDGFGPADPDLPNFRKTGDGTPCFH